MLNEYKPGLEYMLLNQEGQSHDPIFVMKVTVNGIDYEGRGRSKKLAKQAAAEVALQSIIQFKNPLEAQVAMGKVPTAPINMDYTSDDTLEAGPIKINSFEDSTTVLNGTKSITPVKEGTKKPESDKTCEKLGSPASTDKTESNVSIKPESGAKTDSSSKAKKQQNTGSGSVLDQLKNPVMSLNELRPGLTFECNEIGSNPDNAKKFRTTVTVDEKVFEGFGSSKKLSKAASARACLYKLFGVNFTPETNTRHVTTEPEKNCRRYKYSSVQILHGSGIS